MLDRHCGNCAWGINVGENEVCLRSEVHVPIKGETALMENHQCAMGWNLFGSVGIDRFLQKFHVTDTYTMLVEMHHEEMVGSIGTLHL